MKTLGKLLMAALALTLLLTGCASPMTPNQSEPTETAAPATEPVTNPTTEPTTEPPTEPATEPTTEPAPVEVVLKLTAVGDCTLGYDDRYGKDWRFDTMVKTQNGDFGYFFRGVQDIFANDDITLVNLEGTFTNHTVKVPKTYNFRGDPSYVEILTRGSVEAVSLGNNHSRDYGEVGLTDTIRTLEDNDIVYSVDDRCGVYRVKGLAIGFISVNVVYDGTAVEKYIQTAMEDLRAQSVNMIIVSCHWGKEGSHKLTDYQQELGHKIIDWGADLIIGNHPHRLQAVEEYKGKMIFYSLANFCFGGNNNPGYKDSLIVTQELHFIDGVFTGSETTVIPCSVSSVTWRNDFQPTILTGEDGQRILDAMNSYSKPFGISFDEDGHMHKAD